jgi:alkanesulfonate monooxygenase SsuD/methylene tetrahydromethanopterin reductase-like flavin-dependent oxidoreductase (luciferase family)
MIDRALRRVGRIGDGWMVEMSTPEEFASRWRRVRDAAREAGRDPLPDTSMIHFYVNVDDDESAAFAEAKRFYEAYHAGAFPDAYHRWRMVTGTPDQVVERIARFLDAGCTLPILRFASWDPTRQMKRAMKDVFPALRDHAAMTAARGAS